MTNLEIKQLEKNLSCVYRIADYAKKKDITVPCVHKWIKEKRVRTMIISNTVFIVDVD